MSDLASNAIRVSLHGPGVRIQDVIEAGEATKRLLGAVADSMGVDGVEWQIASVQFRCDGCGLTRPDRPGPDEGWTYREPDDLCPDCSALAALGKEPGE